MLRVSDNPPARFPEARPLAEDLGRWRVAYVKSRQEKAFAKDLLRREIPYYLPMMEKRVRRRDNNKLRKTVMPLFPGYLAFAAPDEAVEDVYATHRLSAVLPVEDQAGFAAELAQVQRALEAGSDLERLDRFEPGQPVRVIAGPLLGLEGEVVTARGQTRLIIRVQMFQQAVSLEVDEAFLEKR